MMLGGTVAHLSSPGRPAIRQLRTVVISDRDEPAEALVLVKGAHMPELQFRR